MNNLWILYVLLYGIFKGMRDGMKKAALHKSSANEILFFYTLIGFILILPFSGNAFTLAPLYIFYTFLKSVIVCSAWIFSYKALKNMSVSLYGIMDLSRVVFSTSMGIILLGEDMTAAKLIGLILVITGLLMVNLKKDGTNTKMRTSVLLAALANCFLNAVSGTLDKVLMGKMQADQLQFWFMLFMTVIYGAIILYEKEPLHLSAVKNNYWIVLMSILFVVGDRLLFKANASPSSQVTVMTLIKQSSVIVTILIGRIAFREKNILYKLLCSFVVLSGILISSFWG